MTKPGPKKAATLTRPMREALLALDRMDIADTAHSKVPATLLRRLGKLNLLLLKRDRPHGDLLVWSLSPAGKIVVALLKELGNVTYLTGGPTFADRELVKMIVKARKKWDRS